MVLSRNMPRTFLVLIAGTALLLACGGAKKAPLSADEAKTGEGDGDGGADLNAPPENPAAATAADTPAPISCIGAGNVCSEMTLGGKEATDAQDRCKAAGGEPKGVECAKADIVATCAIDAKNVTLYYYKQNSSEATRGHLSGGKKACKTAGGTFVATAAPKGAGKKKPGGKKK
jgi:hypothetical protein